MAIASFTMPTSIVPVDDEPLHHQRWKSSDVRLVDVQFPPHTTCLWHQHLHYGVYIALTPIHAVEQSTRDDHAKALTKQRGDVFCRDHTRDHLKHVVATGEDAMRIIEVELVRDVRRLAPDAHLPLHVHRTIVLLHEDERCRVYRVTLLRGVEGADSVSLVLPTNAVMVAIHSATVALRNPNVDDTIPADHTREVAVETKTFAPGDDVQLVAGPLALQGNEFDDDGVAMFILTEVL